MRPELERDRQHSANVTTHLVKSYWYAPNVILGHNMRGERQKESSEQGREKLECHSQSRASNTAEEFAIKAPKSEIVAAHSKQDGIEKQAGVRTRLVLLIQCASWPFRGTATPELDHLPKFHKLRVVVHRSIRRVKPSPCLSPPAIRLLRSRPRSSKKPTCKMRATL